MAEGERMAARPCAYQVIDTAGADAPWLAMVHAAAQDRRAFSAQVPAFRDAFRLLLLDLPGHGASRGMPGPYGFAEHAAAVLATLDAAGVDRLHYWGTHTAAGAALLLAARDPARFASLVLEGPVRPDALPPSIPEVVGRVRAIAREQGLDAAREAWWSDSAWFRVMREAPERCRADAHRAMIEEFEGGPWLDEAPPAPVAPLDDALAAIACPVLIVNGEDDLPDFLATAEALERALPDVRRERVAGGGGFPLWECPDAVNAMVRAFLDEAIAHRR